MINIKEKKQCCGCAACVSVCPKSCISMIVDDEGFLYPVVNADKCINCGLCEKVCPFLTKTVKSATPTAYAAKCNDDELRFNSSSGGIFSLLADEILEIGGTVYGVSMSDDCRSCQHIKVTNKENLAKLRGSKYFQSKPLIFYKEIKNILESGTTVLFSGTSCQVDGLRNFLGKNYDNLFLVDIVCHGTPSPALWEKYIEYIERKHNAVVESVNFRHKKNGWQDFGISTNQIWTSKDNDPYMQMFLRDYCLRPSCYSCKAKELKLSDITLADFWGIGKSAPELDDGKGTSMVLVRTEKGAQLFNQLTSKMQYKKVTYKQAVTSNPSEYSSVNRPKERDTFFYDMHAMSFDELTTKYAKKKHKSLKQVLASSFAWKIIRKYIRGGVNDSTSFNYGLLVTMKNK